MNRYHSQTGFTLIEMVMVIVIMGILSVGLSEFIALAASGYADRAGRDQMASAMVVASEKLVRDVRAALPNSVRIGGDALTADNCIEFVPILGGSRYETVPLAAAAGTVSAVSFGNPTALSAYIVVYPIDGADLYTPSDAVPSSITGTRATIPVGTDSILITLGAAHRFVADSPDQRLYGVDDPVAFCQPAGSDRIYRYSGYGYNAAAVLPPTGGTREVLVTNLNTLAAASFDFSSATLTRNAVVSFELTASVDGETLNLGQEVQIRNVP